MLYAYMIVSAMAVFASAAAAAFAWAVANGQFRDPSRGASSIFWDEAEKVREDADDD